MIQLSSLTDHELIRAAATAPRGEAVAEEAAPEGLPAEGNIIPLSSQRGRAQAGKQSLESGDPDEPRITNVIQLSSLTDHGLSRTAAVAPRGTAVAEEAAAEVLVAEGNPLTPASPPSGAQAKRQSQESAETDDPKIPNTIQLASILNSPRGEAQAVDGTRGAKSSPEMQKPEEKSQASGSAEQTLPQTAGRSSQSADNAVHSAEKTHLPSVVSMETLLNGSAPLNAPERIQSGAPAVAEVKQPGTLEQIQLKIGNCAVELKRFKADSMSVVLKPDAQTEVCLNLTLQHGVVEVETQFKRGNFGALNAQWDQLQKALSSQGIRVGPLKETVSSPSGFESAGTFSDSQGQPHGSRQPREATPGKPIYVSTAPLAREKEASPRPRRDNRSWESWA